MRIGIIGTRGIPNFHGGFEQFAEYFSVFLASRNHEVFVYNSSTHPYQKRIFKGVKLIHCYDPEEKVGTIGQFIYDFKCILDSRDRNFDVILQLGYTSSSIWNRFLPKESIIITNMDGLEWKRTKYSIPVRNFLKYAERFAVSSSDYLISDSIGIQEYLKRKYKVKSKYIPYGASSFNKPNEDCIGKFDLHPFNYNLIIARLEPENNIEIILNGVVLSESETPIIVVGKCSNKFGKYLTRKYKNYQKIRFLGGIYDLNELNNLRYFSNLYFHGHSVGGTNPSLLEAMAAGALIVAHDNIFNRSILKEHAFYFNSPEQISSYIQSLTKNQNKKKVDFCLNEVMNNYSWESILKKYLSFINECLKKN